MEISKSAVAAVAVVSVAGGVIIGIRQTGIRQASVTTDGPRSEVSAVADPAGPGVPGASPASSSESAGRAAPAAVPTRAVAPTRPASARTTPARTATLSEEPPPAFESAPAPPPAAPDVIEARPTAAAIGVAQEPEPSSDGPREVVDEALTVPALSVVGLQLESSVTSERAQVEDEVIARITRDVRVADRVAIPSGSRVQGFVTLVERGGRLRERSRLGVRFTTVILGDGTRLPIDTETVYREGESAVRESAAKVGGGAIGGAIIGGILGGAKGAAIGSTIGAGAGTAAVMTGGRNAAVLNPNTPITVRLEQSVTVIVDRERR